ncbi:NAD(P)-binding domain [Phytophthora cactorum]|nr:NAD(P)-binding domain [Phytophthora cactorum]
MVEPMGAGKRPVLTTRRSSQGGIAMSLEMRLPRELLEKIGIKGKEIVKIIKDRDWEIVEPHGLQQQKLYYLPGSKERRDKAKQNVDFFVGEGELYAYILNQGGLRYLLPDDSDVSDVEPTQPSKHSPTETTGEQRKWKRRKKLSTARSKSVEKTPPAKRRRKLSKKSSSVDGSTADEEDRIRVEPRVKLEQATYGGIGQQTEFSEYESSWKARGWRAQLLQDMDVHLLRSVAAVDRRHRALEASNEGQKKAGRPTEGVGPHVQDATEILQELDGLMHSVRASQDDLSSMIESIIAKAERLTIPDRIDPVGRIGIPGFISTGPGSLVLVRDIERYLLLFVAAVRRYQRARKSFCANERTSGSSRVVRRTDLRALQLSIEESKTELQELATIITAEASKTWLEYAQDSTTGTSQSASPSTSQGTSQGITSSQSSSGTLSNLFSGTFGQTDCDGNTDQDQVSSQQSASSPQSSKEVSEAKVAICLQPPRFSATVTVHVVVIASADTWITVRSEWDWTSSWCWSPSCLQARTLRTPTSIPMITLWYGISDWRFVYPLRFFMCYVEAKAVLSRCHGLMSPVQQFAMLCYLQLTIIIAVAAGVIQIAETADDKYANGNLGEWTFFNSFFNSVLAFVTIQSPPLIIRWPKFVWRAACASADAIFILARRVAGESPASSDHRALMRLLAARREAPKAQADASWEDRYLHGSSHEVYSVELPPASVVYGKTFSEVASLSYAQCSGVIVFAITTAQSSQGNGGKLLLNPGDSYTCIGAETVFVIAQDRREANAVTGMQPSHTMPEAWTSQRRGSKSRHLSRGGSARVKLASTTGSSTGNDTPSSLGDYDVSPHRRQSRFINWKTEASSPASSFSQDNRSTWKLEEDDDPLTVKTSGLSLSPTHELDTFSPESAVVQDVASLHLETGHIMVCVLSPSSFPHHLEYLIGPLRVRALRQHRPVVIVTATLPEVDDYEHFQRFVGVNFVVGDPFRHSTLRRAGIHHAFRIVLMGAEGEVADAGTSELLQDAACIALHKTIVTLIGPTRAPRIITELVNRANVHFVAQNLTASGWFPLSECDSAAASTSSLELARNFAVSPAFAAGLTYSTSLCDSLLINQFFNARIKNILREFIFASWTDGGVGTLPSSPAGDFGEAVASPTLSTASAMDVQRSSLFAVEVPLDFVGRTFEFVFHYLLSSDGILVIGLYRCRPDVLLHSSAVHALMEGQWTKTASRARIDVPESERSVPFGYVYVNPQPHEVLTGNDLLYVLSDIQPCWADPEE